MTKLEETHGIKLFGKTIQLQVKQEDPKSEQQQHQHQEQPSLDKRPDKIIPCPRCKSMETKFCYFNNYNVNQPRHFCKGCQRYWTAGGALRNVPVGAGRRKAKLLGHQTLPTNFPENCVLVDGAAFEEYWAHHHNQQLAAAASGGCGGYYPDFPAKRRRDVSYGQTNGSSQDV